MIKTIIGAAVLYAILYTVVSKEYFFWLMILTVISFMKGKMLPVSFLIGGFVSFMYFFFLWDEHFWFSFWKIFVSMAVILLQSLIIGSFVETCKKTE